MESSLLMLIYVITFLLLSIFGIGVYLGRCQTSQSSGTKNSFNHGGKGPQDRQDFTKATIKSGGVCSSSWSQPCGTEDSFNLQGEGQQIFREANIQSGAINPEQNDLSFDKIFEFLSKLIMRFLRREKEN